MKKIIFLNLFLLIHSVYSQQPTSFEFQGKYKVSEGARAIQGTYNSINKYVVVETKMSENEMYDKTINWLNETYNDPEEVFLGKVKGEYIRFKGSTTEPLIYADIMNVPYSSAIYQIEIRFKEGRFKFEIIKLRFFSQGSAYSKPQYIDLDNWETNRINRKNGNEVGSGLNEILAKRKFFNDLLDDFKNYLLNDEKSEDDDW